MSGAEHVLEWLQSWSSEQCDGDWEHEWGVTIETVDNPGWFVKVNLEETALAGSGASPSAGCSGRGRLGHGVDV